MKLYCWRAKSYNEEAFVCAENYDDAQRALNLTRLPWPTEPRPDRDDKNIKHALWTAWFNADHHNKLVDDMLTLTDHDLVVLEIGEVAWAERS